MTLSEEIQAAINRHNGEARSNTPDFILAEYMMACLRAFEMACGERDRWYGIVCEPGGVRRAESPTNAGEVKP